MKTKFTVIVVCLFASSLFACMDKSSAKSHQMVSAADHTASANVQVLQVWEMPKELTEISANVLVDENRMACVEDNDGIIYIYNLKTKAIDHTIPFAGKGDYEGMALVGNTYYILRSDGFLYEVQPRGNEAPQVKTYDLPMESSNDTESLFYDKTHNRLLIGVKEKDLSGANGKGIYSFDLATKKLSTEATMMVLAGEHKNDNPATSEDGEKKKKKGKKHRGEIKPSDIAIHPTTGEIYILNGPQSELLIADPKGHVKSSVQLPENVFPQPEGLCFSPSNELYISSEGGKKGKGVIAKVAF